MCFTSDDPFFNDQYLLYIRTGSVTARSPQQRQHSLTSDPEEPRKIFNERCQAARYTQELIEIRIDLFERFKFKAIVKNSNGVIICEKISKICTSKKEARIDVCRQANRQLGFM